MSSRRMLSTSPAAPTPPQGRFARPRPSTGKQLAARGGYVALNAAKNALLPLADRLAPERGSFGMDGELDLVGPVLARLAPALAAADRPTPRSVLELGPGRTADLCASLILCGAERALGLDVARRVDPAAPDLLHRYARLAEWLTAPDAAVLRRALRTDCAAIRARLAALRDTTVPAVNFAAYDGAHLPVPDGSVDLLLSKSVLEHVRDTDVSTLLAETRRVMSPQGCAVHVIDLRDHLHIAGDSDVVGNWLEALTYGPATYDLMFSRRSTYINRLRMPEWAEAFERAGFDSVLTEVTRWPLPPGFDASRLHSRWAGLERSVLEVGMMVVVLRAV